MFFTRRNKRIVEITNWDIHYAFVMSRQDRIVFAYLSCICAMQASQPLYIFILVIIFIEKSREFARVSFTVYGDSSPLMFHTRAVVLNLFFMGATSVIHDRGRKRKIKTIS